MKTFFTEEQTELFNMLDGFRFRVEYNQAERYIIIDDPRLMVLTLDVSKPTFGYHNDDDERLLFGIGFHIGYPMVVDRYDDGDLFSVKVLFRRGVDIVDDFDNLGCIRLQSADHDPIYLYRNTEILFDEDNDALCTLQATNWDDIKAIFPKAKFTTMAHAKANARNLEDIIEDMDPANGWKHEDAENGTDNDADDNIHDDDNDLI